MAVINSQAVPRWDFASTATVLPLFSPASLWSTSLSLDPKWSALAPFAFWLIDAVRPERFISVGDDCFDAHLTYCEAIDRLKQQSMCRAVHWSSVVIGGAGTARHHYHRRYHDRRFGTFSKILQHDFLEGPATSGSFDLIHLTDVADIERLRASMSPRCVVALQGRSATQVKAVCNLYSSLYPAFSLDVGQGFGLIGFGSSLPPGISRLMSLGIDDRVLLSSIYAHFGALASRDVALSRHSASSKVPQNGSTRPRTSSLDEDDADKAVQACRSEPPVAALQEELAMFKSLLWSSARREDLLISELSSLKATIRGSAERILPSLDQRVADADEKAAEERYIAHLSPTLSDPGMINATVSVVIPTYNAGSELNWLLKKLCSQSGISNVEIVIVDSGSKDDTVATARLFGCKVVEIDNKLFSHSFARNLGADIATGQYIIFMVQDAFPVGNTWIYDLLKALLRPLRNGSYLAAVSCAEYPRRDSELIYNAGINTHYQFLGCFDQDKIGRLTTSDNHGLRTQGQLSDVTCLISRSLFMSYRHHGRYAEDLLLGIRLIKDGYQIAMLSSIKVIHSHTRSLGYYVRRVFVDVYFLREVFEDFPVPAMKSALAVYTAAVWCMGALPQVRPSVMRSPADVLADLSATLNTMTLPTLFEDALLMQDFETPMLAAWIRRLAKDGSETRIFSDAQIIDVRLFRDMLISRLLHLKEYVEQVHLVLDVETRDDLVKAIVKSIGMTLGAGLAFYFLEKSANKDFQDAAMLDDLKQLLLAGI